ncbi:MAG: hypothetical protein ACQER4_00730 [Bacteroidota bacterium]
MVDVIFLGLGVGLVVIGVIAILVAGVRNIALGKFSPKKMVVMLVPFAIFGVTFGTTGSADQSGIVTMIIMIAAMLVAILFTGLKGTLKL